MVTPAAIPILVGLLALAASCGGEGGVAGPTPTPAQPVEGVLTVRAFDFGFEPESFILEQGQQVRLVLQNDGDVLHNLRVDDIDVDVIESRSTGPLKGDEGELFVGADPGDEGSITFVPREAGEFEFYCSIPPHRALGMEGRLLVR